MRNPQDTKYDKFYVLVRCEYAKYGIKEIRKCTTKVITMKMTIDSRDFQTIRQ